MNIIQEKLEKIAHAVYMKKIAGRDLKFIAQALNKRNLHGLTSLPTAMKVDKKDLLARMANGHSLKDVIKGYAAMPKTNVSQAFARRQSARDLINNIRARKADIDFGV